MISKKAQYSLYALTYLAKKYEHGPVLISEIAEAEKLPKKFLETILLELKNMGIVSSKKGKGGGYYLIKKPENVNFAEIIRFFDGAIALLPCVTYNYYEECNHCKDETTCGVRSVVKEIRDKTVAILKNTTLKDIIDKEKNNI
ncbi:MAG: Rrf2 family transcriptional regulator [Bacteroidia bacterium]|nr:Rrf2 family transcriptional regulator [Bacteroidia bacterium]